MECNIINILETTANAYSKSFVSFNNRFSYTRDSLRDLQIFSFDRLFR